jgi:Dolichyl-phosphate-mannose-protein mannosyltransferase
MFSKKIFRSDNPLWIVITVSIITYIYSLRIVSSDPYFHYRWLAFGLHMVSLVTVLYFYLSKTVSKVQIKKIFTEKELNPLIIVLFVTIIANFVLLSLYPYVSIADELRDGGVFTMRIASGVLKNIFAYGSYDAHGLIIPTLTVPFYYLFGNSTLTFRFPAALLSTADVLLLYLLIRVVINKSTAFWSALVLATLPLHMFFAHTQVVIAYNFFWVPVILLVLFTLLKKQRFPDYLFFGTVLGFAAGFHAAIRVFACIILLVLFFLEFRDIVLMKFKSQDGITFRLTKLLVLIVFLFVGFGPRLLFTGPQDFFHSSRFVFENQLQKNTPMVTHDISVLKSNYVRSLMIYTYEPATFFFPVNKPIFTPLLSIFFLLGVGYAFFVLKNPFINILLFLLVVLPFFTSAITDLINASHRASPLFAVASVFVGIGITYCLSLIKYKIGRYIIIILLFCYLAFQVLTFYTEQPANEFIKIPGYLDMHMFYFLQQDKQYQGTPENNLQYMQHPGSTAHICLYVSPSNYQNFIANYDAVHEQQEFLLPSADIHYREKSAIRDNEMYIIKGSCSKEILYTKAIHTDTIDCATSNYFTCPLDYSGKILIHY